MKTSPYLQQLIEQVAAQDNLILSEPNVYLPLTLVGCPIHLLIETTAERQVVVACSAPPDEDEAEPARRFPTGSSTSRMPLELLFSPQAWVAIVRELALLTMQDAVALADHTEVGTKPLGDQDWPAQEGKMNQRTDGAQASRHMDGCQGTHQCACSGELWTCSACGKRVCDAEGTTDEPKVCDTCWDKQYNLAMKPDALDETALDDQPIVIACDCIESGGDCGTWLELTPDGILAVEDKDGLRVSLMLPLWLDEAIRQAVAVQQLMTEVTTQPWM